MKRLDDPGVQGHSREVAIERLERFRADAVAGDASTKSIDDLIAAPLTSAYISGNLDDHERSEVMKTLAEIDGARVDPALMKAFDDCGNDTKLAADALARRAKHENLGSDLADALFTCFAKYAPSKRSREVGQSLHDAVLAVKAPSYVPRAIALLATPIVPSDSLDEHGVKRFSDPIDFWQRTSIELLGVVHDKSGIKPLVAVLMTKTKLGLAPLAKTSLLAMPRDAEPVLAIALAGNDPDLAKLRGEWMHDESAAALIDTLAATGLESARDAVLASIPSLTNDANRAAAAQTFVWLPTSARLTETFQSIYARLPPITHAASGDTGLERASLLLAAGDMFEPRLFAWALAEAAKASGDSMVAARASAIQTAIKLMQPEDKKTVADAIDVLENHSGLSPMERREIAGNIHVLFDEASKALDACAIDAGCYVKLLDETIPPEANANWKAIKAATMCGLFGDDRIRKELVQRVGKVKNPGVRRAMALAIARLAQHGDVESANVLDAIAASEKLAKDDALVIVAGMLRSRG